MPRLGGAATHRGVRSAGQPRCYDDELFKARGPSMSHRIASNVREPSGPFNGPGAVRGPSARTGEMKCSLGCEYPPGPVGAPAVKPAPQALKCRREVTSDDWCWMRQVLAARKKMEKIREKWR